MTTTPAITLTATPLTIIGGADTPGYMRVTLCGYGPIIPCVPGSGELADAGVPQIVGPQDISPETPLSVLLYGNDVITPQGTFYEVAILDQNQEVVQANNYMFSGSGTFDISELTPMLPPYGFPIQAMRYLKCDGSVIGGNRTFTAPGPVIAAAYNGVLIAPESYSSTGNVIVLDFDVELGDRIDAFCIA